jgi:hypothetical protein
LPIFALPMAPTSESKPQLFTSSFSNSRASRA